MTPARLAAWSAGGLVVGLALALLAWGLIHPQQPIVPAVVGRPAPDLTVRSFDGQIVSLAALRGSPVVLNFYASWCASCRQEAAALAEAATAHGSVRFLGADIQDSEAAGLDFETQVHHPYPAGPVTAGTYLDFGVTGPPETYFIDSAGVIRAHHIGPVDGQLVEFYLKDLR